MSNQVGSELNITKGFKYVSQVPHGEKSSPDNTCKRQMLKETSTDRMSDPAVLTWGKLPLKSIGMWARIVIFITILTSSIINLIYKQIFHLRV